jgi:PAS domain-containing protein
VWRFVLPRELQTFKALFEHGIHGNSRGETVLRAVDGTLVAAFVSCNSFQVDDLQSICLVVTDLSQQKRQEEILASEALARAILEQAAEALVVTDRTGRIIRAKARFAYRTRPVDVSVRAPSCISCTRIR